MRPSERCLMIAFGSTLLVEDGYTVRVMMATRAVVEVQAGGAPAPVVLGFESLRSLLRRAAVRAAKRRITDLGALPLLVPLVPERMPGSYALNQWWAAIVIWIVCRLCDTGIVHAQSHAAAAAASRALRHDRQRTLVFDVHGVDIEERVLYGGLAEQSGNHRLRTANQRRAVARSDVVITVSRDLEMFVRGIAAEAPESRPKRWESVPCVLSLADSDEDDDVIHEAARRNMNLAGRPCVLYLGGSSGWQLPRATVAAFAEVLRQLPDAFFLILSGDRETFDRLCDEAGIPRTSRSISSCPHREVTARASAADVALLLREDNIVNRVASPTKFAEFLSMGIPVVITSVLVDFAALVRDHDVGVVVPGSNDPVAVATAMRRLLDDSPADKQQRRRRCREVCRDRLSFQSILPTYRRIYRSDTPSRVGGV